MQPVQVLAHSGRLWKRQPEATCTSSTTPRSAQSCCSSSRSAFSVSGTQGVVEQAAQLAYRHGLGRTDQGGFKNPFRIHRIHDFQQSQER